VLAAFIALVVEAASTSETSVNFYQTTRHNIPEDSHHLHTCCHENLKSHLHDHRLAKYESSISLLIVNVISVLKTIENVHGISRIGMFYVYGYSNSVFVDHCMKKMELTPWSRGIKNLTVTQLVKNAFPYTEPEGSLVTVILKYFNITTFLRFC
jgi:hypothetical protein